MSKLLKKYLRREISGLVDSKDGGVVVHYQGLSSSEEYAFRSALRENNADMQVIKASIARVHLREAGFEGDINAVFKGPVALVTSRDPEGAVGVARSMVHLVKEHKKVKLQGAIYDGSVMGGAGVEDLSRMPTREQLLSRLAGAVQAPTRGLAKSLYQMSSKVASAFDALRRKREGEEG